MKRISLIANSGIQYIKFSTEIDKDFGKQPENKIYYHEPFDNNTDEFVLDPLLKHSQGGDAIYYRYQQLYENNLLANGRIKDEVDLQQLTPVLVAEEDGNLRRALKAYQRKWIPLPYFKDNAINKDLLFPTDWVRVFIVWLRMRAIRQVRN